MVKSEHELIINTHKLCLNWINRIPIFMQLLKIDKFSDKC
jgi:hypothetical protein